MTLFSSLYTGRLDRELGTDDSTVLFTTARRKAAVNEGQEQFADITECLLRRSTLVMTGGTIEYDLNSTTVIPGGDFVRWSKEQIQIRYTDAAGNVTVASGDALVHRDIPWLNRFEPGWQNSTVSTATGQQVPRYVYERMDGGARYLGFYPTPSTGSSASMVAVLPYVARPTPMSSDTNEPFTVSSVVRGDLRIFHQALVHYGAAQLEKLRRDDQASDAQLSKFMGYVQRFIATGRKKGGDTISVARRYFR
jgi:hypothetical protein